ncbi:MAG: HI0074 family nucleotidyltransferase substrate-binding subunit [Bdellovibrionales bacterium]|nr:HI0074 family nucleotidyltransferase substrate-binding subunit [Bdellovibrionales bacterium]
MNDEKRWKQRFENFEKSYHLLCRRQKDYEKNPNSEAFQMSLIQSYEISVELARNTLKDYLENSGHPELETPKKIIRQAFQSEMISNAEKWMEALKKRNQTSHIYNPKILREVLEFINNTYFDIVRDLYYNLKKEVESPE